MRIVLILAGIVTAIPVVAILVLFVAGLFIGRRHRVSRSVEYGVAPDALFATITDIERWPAWRSRLKAIERLPDRDGHAVWREKGRAGGQTLLVRDVTRLHRRLITEVVDERAYSGGWTWEVAPSGQGATLTITEAGNIRNPVFRAVAAWFLDLRSTIDGVHRDLRHHLGEPSPDFSPRSDEAGSALRAATGEGLVLVCGAAHSGTTLMLALLDSHPDIVSVPIETKVFLDLSEEEARQVIAEWPARFSLDPSVRIVAEKTPRHVNAIATVREWLPEARIIVLLRDGRDAALSAKARVGELAKTARRWRRAVEDVEPFRHDDHVLVVRYEDLVREPEPALRRVCDFVSVPFDAAMLSHHAVPRRWWDSEIRPADRDRRLVLENHNRHRNWQINQPIFNGSGRWRNEMTPDDKALFKRIAGGTLIAAGYATDDSW